MNGSGLSEEDLPDYYWDCVTALDEPKLHMRMQRAAWEGEECRGSRVSLTTSDLCAKHLAHNCTQTGTLLQR